MKPISYHWMISGSASWMITPSPTWPATASAFGPSPATQTRNRRQVQAEPTFSWRSSRSGRHRRGHSMNSSDDPERLLGLGDLHGLLADETHRGVTPTDAHDHPAVGQVVQRRVQAREHRRVTRRRVGHEVAELDRGGLRNRASGSTPARGRASRTSSVAEPMALGELDQLEPARERRIRENRDAEFHVREPIAARRGRSCRRSTRPRALRARRRRT